MVCTAAAGTVAGIRTSYLTSTFLLTVESCLFSVTESCLLLDKMICVMVTSEAEIPLPRAVAKDSLIVVVKSVFAINVVGVSEAETVIGSLISASNLVGEVFPVLLPPAASDWVTSMFPPAAAATEETVSRTAVIAGQENAPTAAVAEVALEETFAGQ